MIDNPQVAGLAQDGLNVGPIFGQTCHRRVEVRIVENDCGGLAAELQRYRSQ